MNNLDIRIKEEIKKDPKVEIFSLQINNEKIWVKRARKTNSNLLHHLAYKIFDTPLLIPVETKKAKEALIFESSKLQYLHEKGISVPEVTHVTETYFCLKDSGKTVHDIVKNSNYNEAQTFFEKIVISLANLHKNGEYHGGSQIKNFTYFNDEIYFIDFEESFSSTTSLDILQFRDLFLFLFSLSKLKTEINYEKLIQQYIELSGKTNVIEKFHLLAKQASFFSNIISYKPIWNIIDSDTQSVYRLLETLKKIT